MANMQFNSSFYKKMSMIATATSRKAVADLSKRTAHWGIKGNGDLAKIMGVLEFGDPGHTVPNTPKGSQRRKTIEDAVAAFGGNDSAIPPRPWLRKSIRGSYRSKLVKYINTNLPKVLQGFPKSGQNIVNTNAEMTTDEFLQGLAEVGMENARNSWETANFTPNAPMTLQNKSDPRPLHGKGDGENAMSAEKITAWSE